ncbi:MAG TPA: DUF3558 family protein [Pseudonocardiaceae bacterium]|jgi:hypothetical protein
MHRLSHTIAAGLAAAALMAVAGCNHDTPSYIAIGSEPVQPPAALPPAPPTTPHGASSVAAPPPSPSASPFVPHPLDISTVIRTPCQAISDDTRTAHALHDGDPGHPGGAASCRWIGRTDQTWQLNLAFGTIDLKSRYATAQHPQSDSAHGDTKTRLIEGYPAISTATLSGPEHSCDLDVAVADNGSSQQHFRINILGVTGDTCPMADALATEVITRLAAR